jgi:hypothetical protein
MITLVTASLALAGSASAQWSIEDSYIQPVWRLLGYGVELVGRDLNGTSLNGTLLDGHQVVGVSLDNIQVKGHLVARAKLKRTRFSGISNWGFKLAGPSYGGALFQAELDNGRTLPLRVTSVKRHPAKGHKDVLMYEVWYPTADGWRPLCGMSDNGTPLRAIPLEGRWDLSEGTATGGSWIDDPDAFTFACESQVLAKCVLGGYKPWRKALVCVKGAGCEMRSLAGHHQACTRMLRADYCGDGRSHTVEDVLVNMYDGAGARADSESWAFEAEWDAAGARCVAQPRLQQTQPPCLQALEDQSCGDKARFNSGTLIMSETGPSEP